MKFARTLVTFAGTRLALVLLILALPVAGGGQLSVTSSPSITVRTSVATGSVRQGEAIVISWQALDAPPGSAVALWPVKALTGHSFDAIASGLPPSGNFTWRIPVFVVQPLSCAPDITGGCVGSMNPTTYRILARLYVPADADIDRYGPGSKAPDYAAIGESAVFTMAPAVAR
jgi:hypothetical protein